jgi:S-(hydroxymethyl)glutathione dehydrogenase / alcohol dehydrogenase
LLIGAQSYGKAGRARSWVSSTARAPEAGFTKTTCHFYAKVQIVVALTRMRAAVFSAPRRPLAIEQLEIEPPRRGEVALRMLASGVCRSDLHVIDGDWAVTPPVVLGHEGFAEVESVGEGVLVVRPGDRVTLSWLAPCNHCRRCHQGKPWLCEDSGALQNRMVDGSTRLHRPGGGDVWPYLGVGTFGERSVVPESAAVAMPAELPATVGALIGCAVATGVGAVINTARVEPGAGVVVIGCGGVGLSIVMGAALAGADPIVAVDLSDDKLEMARSLGATHGVRGGDGMPTEVWQICPGGPDYVFEALGLVKTIESAIALIPRGGTGVLVGLTPDATATTFDALLFADGSKTLLGCNYGFTQPAVDFPRLARLHLAGKLPIDRLVSERIELDAVNDAFARMSAGSGARRVITY